VSLVRDELVRSIQRHGDELLAAALTVIALVEIAFSGGSETQRLLAGVGTVVIGLAAARRSRQPLLLVAGMVGVTAYATVFPQLGGDTLASVFFVFLLLAIYSAAAHTNGRQTVIAAGMTVSIAVIDLATEVPVTADGVIFMTLLLGAPWVAGRAVRQRRLKEDQLEHERATAAAAIMEERARIARELHDVVAHSISVMVLQARGGRRALDAEPDDARSAFDSIEGTGQQALDEMRRLLGMLRRDDDELPLAPQPSLRHLDLLVAEVEAAGLPVQVTIEGEPRALPPGVDLSAFRIVQEALTNALRHAGPARARVLLRYTSDDFELEIADDGQGTGDASGPGYGLVGMRERVSVYGGELQTGRRPGGGYELRVRLPLRSARA
jgi:signal transduction histidine kinase